MGISPGSMAVEEGATGTHRLGLVETICGRMAGGFDLLVSQRFCC